MFRFNHLLRGFIKESISVDNHQDGRFFKSIKKLDLTGRVGLTILKSSVPFYLCLPKNKRKSSILVNPKNRDRYFIQFHNPFHPQGDKNGIKCPSRLRIIFIMIIIMSLNLLILSISQVYYERKLSAWQTNVQSRLNSSNVCITNELYDQLKDDDFFKASTIASWLNLIGSPWSTTSGMFFYSVLCFITLFLAIFISGLRLSSNKIIYLNHLTFYAEPSVEKKRIEYLKEKVIQDIKDNGQFERMYLDEINEKRSNKLTEPSLFDGLDPQIFEKFYTISTNQFKFKTFLTQYNLSKFVKPNNITPEAHKRICHFNKVIIILLYSYFIMIAILGSLILGYSEIFGRIKNRSEEYKCLKNNPNTSPYTRSLMAKAIYDNTQIEAYSMFVNSTITLWNPIIYQQLLGFIEPRYIPFVIESTFIYNLVAHGFGLYCLIAVSGCHHLSVWLKQIQNQLKLCADLLSELNKLSFFQVQLDDPKKEVEAALTITYINFIMFKSDQKEFRRYLQFLSAATSSFILVLIAIIYILGCVMNKDHLPYTIMVISFLVCLLNLIGHVCGSVMHEISFTYYLIGNVLARSTLNDMQLSYIVTLWRRQSLTIHELKTFYQVCVVGIKLTYSNMLQFNSYILAFLLYISRGASINLYRII